MCAYSVSEGLSAKREAHKYFYLFADPNNPHWLKFGETLNLSKRLSSYQTGHSGRVNFVKTWEVPAFARDKELMPLLIRAAKDHRDGSEWVQMSRRQAIDIVNIEVEAMWSEVSTSAFQPTNIQRSGAGGDFTRDPRRFDMNDLSELDKSDWRFADSCDSLSGELADWVLRRFIATELEEAA